MSITANEARAKLYPLIEKVNDDAEAVEIISKKGRAWLVPDDEYRSWRETDYLLRSPANAQFLRESIAQADAGEMQTHDLGDLDLDESA